MPLFSVIIPVFNTTEQRFRRCISSILNQTYSDFEVLVVDDGSEKEYFEQIAQIGSCDDRVRIIRQMNKGAGAARNTGVREAKGKYVVFVDSDDVAMDYMLEDAERCLQRFDVDLVCGVVHREPEDRWKQFSYKYVPGSWKRITDEISKEDYINNMLGYECEYLSFDYGHISDGPVSKVCRSSIAKNIQFEEDNIWDEDTLWNIDLALRCNTICVSTNVWYLYLMNELSQTHVYRKDCPSEFAYRIEQELTLVKETCSQCLQGAYARIWTNTHILFDTFLIHPSNTITKKERFSIFRDSIKQPAYVEMLKGIDFKNEKSQIKFVIKHFLKYLNLYFPRLAFFGWIWLLKNRRGIH